MNKSVLIISDLHAPYMHEDAINFLKAVKKKYKPDTVIGIWDELDSHWISFHDSDPDLDSAGKELEKAREQLQWLEKLFPKMDLVESNHWSLLYRRWKAHWIPRHMLLEYRDVIFWVKKKDWSVKTTRGQWWNWHDSITLELSNWEQCHFIHQAEAWIGKHAWHYGMSIVAWHRHSKFQIEYVSSPYNLRFWMVVWCLIDHKSMAFDYNKLQSKRPILWVGLILEWIPVLVPMMLNSEWKWNKQI